MNARADGTLSLGEAHALSDARRGAEQRIESHLQLSLNFLVAAVRRAKPCSQSFAVKVYEHDSNLSCEPSKGFVG